MKIWSRYLTHSMMLALGLVIGVSLASGIPGSIAANPKPAYMVVSGSVVGGADFSAYGAKAGPLAQAAGVKVLARGQVTVMEGEWKHPQVLTVERFDSMPALNDFWYSDGYQEAIKLRAGKFNVDFIVALEGM